MPSNAQQLILSSTSLDQNKYLILTIIKRSNKYYIRSIKSSNNKNNTSIVCDLDKSTLTYMTNKYNFKYKIPKEYNINSEYEDVNENDLPYIDNILHVNDKTLSQQLSDGSSILTNVNYIVLQKTLFDSLKKDKEGFNILDKTAFEKFTLISKVTILKASKNTVNKTLLISYQNNKRIECECVYNSSKLILSNAYNAVTNFKISKTSDIKTTNEALNVVNSLIAEGRADGNFGIESGLINAKLVLLNRLNKNILIAPINWNDEHFINMQDENFIQNIKNNSNITEKTKLILVPIFYQNHISTLIIENTRPEKLAIFDSSTAHLEEIDNALKVKTTILNSNLVKNIIVLNTENLQDLDLSNFNLLKKVNDYCLQQEQKLKKGTEEERNKFNLKKSKSDTNIKNIRNSGNKIHLGNCGYYALHFAEYIMTKQDEYKKPYETIEQIRNNMATIKEQIQEGIKEKLNYTNVEVLFNYLANDETDEAYTKRAMYAGEMTQTQTQVQSQVQTPPTFDQTRQFIQQHLKEIEEQYNNDRQHIQATQQHTRQSSHSSSASFIVE